jgi:hypothetical protein
MHFSQSCIYVLSLEHSYVAGIEEQRLLNINEHILDYIIHITAIFSSVMWAYMEPLSTNNRFFSPASDFFWLKHIIDYVLWKGESTQHIWKQHWNLGRDLSSPEVAKVFNQMHPPATALLTH